MANTVAYRRLDMLKTLIDCYEQYKKVDVEITQCSMHDLPVVQKRPLNISMRPDKLIEAIGLKIHDIDYYCSDIVRQACSQTKV